jgi:hypothetical protein
VKGTFCRELSANNGLVCGTIPVHTHKKIHPPNHLMSGPHPNPQFMDTEHVEEVEPTKTNYVTTDTIIVAVTDTVTDATDGQIQQTKAVTQYIGANSPTSQKKEWDEDDPVKVLKDLKSHDVNGNKMIYDVMGGAVEGMDIRYVEVFKNFIDQVNYQGFKKKVSWKNFVGRVKILFQA